MEKLKESLWGSKGGITASEVKSLAQRDTFSDFLPYLYYNKENRNYLNLDNTIGYLWECCPLTFASMREIKQIETILKSTYCCHKCDGTQLQFTDVLHKKRCDTKGGHLNVGKKTSQIC